MREMYESVQIIFQILSNLSKLDTSENNSTKLLSKDTNFYSFFNFLFEKEFKNLNKNSKYSSMESLINHFKYYSEGIKISRGFVYKAVEAPKGEFGVTLIADGSSSAYRCKIRTPAYHHLQIMPRMLQGHFFADVVTVLGSQDIVFGDVDR